MKVKVKVYKYLKTEIYVVYGEKKINKVQFNGKLWCPIAPSTRFFTLIKVDAVCSYVIANVL